jgi:hypothetical protein
MIAIPTTRAQAQPALERTGLVCALLTVPFLLHAKGLAEATIAIAGLCFLADSAIRRDWRWLRAPWFLVGAAWWGWLVFCSLPLPMLGVGEGGGGSFAQAAMAVRFLILTAAMEHFILRDSPARRWMFGVVAAAAAYIAAHCIFQFVVGHNLYGWPRYGEGELTGPFGMPRAGSALARILLPSAVPPAAGLLSRGNARSTLLAYTLLLGGVVVMVLIGQRMPLVLTVAGLLVVAVLLPRLRAVTLASGLACAILLAASPVVAPLAYHRLVVKFTDQMEHFGSSHYGLLYTRAAEIARQNPLTGLGFNGFGTGCGQERYFRPSTDGREADGGGSRICWVHPHNFYAQAVTDGGYIGLALFCALAVAWLAPLARGLWHDPAPLRVALFATVLLQLWPVQSTSGFFTLPLGGWFFLLLGWALAEARYGSPEE